MNEGSERTSKMKK